MAVSARSGVQRFISRAADRFIGEASDLGTGFRDVGSATVVALDTGIADLEAVSG